MDMLTGERIAAANLTDWRKLAQGLHARYIVDDFGTGARFVAAVGEAGFAFIGPPDFAISAMGNKTAARARVHKVGVPVLPVAVPGA